MTIRFGDFKNYLNFFSHEERLREMNFMINEFNKSNRNGEKIAKKFNILNELKILKKQIIINYKEHSHFE